MHFKVLDSVMQSLHEKFDVPGAQCRVYYKHKEVYRCNVGTRDIATGEPMRGDEQLNVFSATKPVTAVAAMQLFERGILAPNDYLYWYFPEYKNIQVVDENGWPRPVKEHITLRHLLSMTCGLAYDLGHSAIKQVIAEKGQSATTVDIVRAMAQNHLLFEPGTHWRYCEGHDIMAAVIEVATGMRYSEYVKKNIFDPLEMHSSTFHFEEADPARFVCCYNEVGGKLVHRTPDTVFRLSDNYESGGASLITTADDYIKFVDALSCKGMGANGNRILSPESVDLMRQNLLSPEMMKDIPWRCWYGYGYGYGVRTLVDRGIAGSYGPVGEFGWDGLKGAYLIADPENEISLFYVEQTGRHKDMLFPRLRNAMYVDLFAK